MKVSIVTGGAKGIGKAIVEMLAREGNKVIINYNTSEEEAKQLKQKLSNEGCIVDIFKANLTKREEAKQLVQYTIDTYGDIDILVNNAGIAQIKLFTDITDSDWNNMISTNLNSVFYMTQETVKNMIKNKKGCIINISSIYGITGGSCEVHYSVTKAGIDGLTKSLAKELAPSNIRVNSIAPGAIQTDMNKDLKEETIEVVKNEIPMGKFGTPEDIAKCAKWLIDDEYTTGQIISPNGGWVIKETKLV